MGWVHEGMGVTAGLLIAYRNLVMKEREREREREGEREREKQ